MRITSVIAIVVAAISGARPGSAQSTGRVAYTLRVDSADLSAVSVEMRIHEARPGFRLAMSTHPEYDDQYWRYVTDLTATSAGGAVQVVREDSAVWHVTGAAGEITVRYQVRYPTAPPMQQAGWKAHLMPEGGLIGGPHSFLYLVGAERSPVTVSVALPLGWEIATGLAPSERKLEFRADDAEALIDSPMLVGRLRDWQFTIDGVPHHIAYLGHPGGVPFDSTLMASNVERIARETVRMFGSMPYPRYQFLFEDGVLGGLEHLNSVSIGLPSARLARDPNAYLLQIAHEFFHTWNEVHLRPASWIGIRHERPAPTGELWWSEGVTLYYADLLLRRAGLHTTDSTRVAHLEQLLATYSANPSHAAISPEQASRGFNQAPGANGDFTPSMYTQGEVLGMVFDLMIRDRSRGRRSLDDAMRDLARAFDPHHGFTGADIQRAVSAACGCDARSYFDRYVRQATAIDFNQELAGLGLHAVVRWEPARAEAGVAMPDARVSGYLVPGEAQPRLQVWFPATVWGRAGLHTGDRVLSWSGAAMHDAQQLRTAISQLHFGDTVQVAVLRNSGRFDVRVVVGGYDRPVVRIEEVPAATAQQRALRAQWVAGGTRSP